MTAKLSAKKWMNGDGQFVDGDEDGLVMAYVAGYDEGKRAAQQVAEADRAVAKCPHCYEPHEPGHNCPILFG